MLPTGMLAATAFPVDQVLFPQPALGAGGTVAPTRRASRLAARMHKAVAILVRAAAIVRIGRVRG